MGTGPFKFVSEQSGVSITLEKNPDYFGGEPSIDKVIYVISTDTDTAYQAFMNGELDYLTDVPASSVAALEADSNYKVGCLSAGRRFQLCFNMNGEYTSDLAVRQAVAKALDREEISTKGTNGLQAPAYGFYPPFLDWAYNADADIGEQDVEGAIQLLEDAGYTKDADGYYLHLSWCSPAAPTPTAPRSSRASWLPSASTPPSRSWKKAPGWRRSLPATMTCA